MRARGGGARRVGSGLAAAWLLVPAAVLAAETGWPRHSPSGWDLRGTGGGLAIVGAAAWWGVVLAWMATVDWVSRDATRLKVAPAFWATVCGLVFAVAALVAWWLPWSAAALLLMLTAWLAPVVTYAVARNRSLPPAQRVLTSGHARRVAARLLAPLGIQIDDPFAAEEALPTVTLAAAGGTDDADNAARVARAAALPGFEEARRTMLAAVLARAAVLTIECGPEQTTVRHEVDGAWEPPRVRQPPRSRKEKEAWVTAPATSRDLGLAIVVALKALAGLPPEARAPASGRFLMQVDGKPRHCRLVVRQGAGDRLTVHLEAPAVVFKKAADLGMPAAVAERLGGLLAIEKGLLVLSAPPANGLTTTFDVVALTADRLLRDFISLEDAAAPPREIQNVKPVRFDARTGVTPQAALAAALKDYPAAILTRDVRDAALVQELARLAAESQFVILSLPAGDACDAVARLLALGIPPQQLGRILVGSLAQRLIRRLCPKCRQAYEPSEDLRARLKIDAPAELHKRSEQGCRVCGGTGYLGRTAVFELASGAAFRQAIATGAGGRDLRAAAVREGMRPLREAAVAVAVAGVTSLEEIQRVFTAPAAATTSKGPAA